MCSMALHIVEILYGSGLDLHDVFLCASWFSGLSMLAMNPPRRCTPILLLFYLSVVAAELSLLGIRGSNSNPRLWLHVSGSVCGLSSGVVILCMPFRCNSSASRSISAVGAKSTSERTPEEALRLWQFLGATWIWPLIVIGKKRQLQQEDIYELSHNIQSRRLSTAYRKLRQSSVFRRLLRANAVDCCILPLLASAQLVLEFASPILLHQFLRAMEQPSLGKQVPIVYALLLLTRGVFATQFSMLEAWYVITSRSLSIIRTLGYIC